MESEGGGSEFFHAPYMVAVARICTIYGRKGHGEAEKTISDSNDAGWIC